MEPAPIQALSPATVNRIAAGEIIHRPASALKELLENSIDAGATRVAVTLRDGGLHTLSIVDNGCGIRVSDFPILCERFTTSKLSDYSDLRSLGTFGFRGEALASITHVARVTVTSMTRGAPCAYKASFLDGKMVTPDSGSTTTPDGKPVQPRACAGVQGTVIHVEDLFFNVPIRRAALRNAHSEEYARSLDMLCKYAVHYSGRVSLSCKKQGQSKLDLNTPLHASVPDNIRAIYGASVARELLPLERKLDAAECAARGIESASHVHFRGWVSNANFSQKKLQLLLFINARLVESSSIRRVFDSVYARVLPKHTHPFVYLSIDMDPRILDVNVHPTKKEVHFLSEESIVSVLEEALEAAIKGANKSRVFYARSITAGAAAMGEGEDALATNTTAAVAAQRSGDAAMDFGDRAETEEKYAAASSAAVTVPPAPSSSTAMDLAVDEEDDLAAMGSAPSSSPPATASSMPRLSLAALPASYRPAPSAGGPFTSLRPTASSPAGSSGALNAGPRRDDKLVRTDNRQGKMDMFFTQSQKPPFVAGAAGGASAAAPQSSVSADERGRKRPHAALDGDDAAAADSSAQLPSSTSSGGGGAVSRRVRPAPAILLTSVQNLLSAIAASSHPQLHDLLSAHTYVGFVSPAYSLVQFRTRLYLLNTTNLSRAFFYQTALRYFGHHPLLLFERPLPLRRLLRMALDHPSQTSRTAAADAAARDALADEYTELLVSRAAMLKEYFALAISDGADADEEGDGAQAHSQSPLDRAQLLGIPELAEQYNPPLLLLPLFLLQLARDCNWSSEQECFESVAHCLAEFYKLRSKENLYLSPNPATQSAAAAAGKDGAASISKATPLPSLAWWVPHVLFPLLRHRSAFAPPASAASDGTATQVAALENLYKIFERC